MPDEPQEETPFERIEIDLADGGKAIVAEEPSERISFERYASDGSRTNPNAVYIGVNSEGANWSEASLKADIESELGIS